MVPYTQPERAAQMFVDFLNIGNSDGEDMIYVKK